MCLVPTLVQLPTTEFLRLMADAMADGVIMTDQNREIALINRAARELLGVGDGEVTAGYLKDRLGFYPFDLVTEDPSMREIREELIIGDKVLHSIVSPVNDNDGNLVGVVVVLRDITLWKDNQKNRDNALQDITHELRTPLTSMTGAIDILLRKGHDPISSKQRRYLDMARECCQRLGANIDELLDGRGDEQERSPLLFRPIDLGDLAKRCVERFYATAEAKEAALQFGADTTGVRIVGDATQLMQVLNNLISNAIKFTPKHGTIAVEVFGPGVAAGQVGVSVWNNGEPIVEKERERVFDRIDSSDDESPRQVRGTALGLPISRSIVERHGGRIWVEQASLGTRFVFTLPAAPADAPEDTFVPDEDDEFSENAGEARPGVGRTILVIDDDRNTTYILKGALMAIGYEVHVANDAHEAIAIARKVRPNMITIDVVMPEVDGLALVEIFKHDPDTHNAAIMVVSAHGERKAAISAGADAYMSKPLDMTEFCNACTTLITEHDGGEQLKILVVEDDPHLRLISREVLEHGGYTVREASDGHVALAEAQHFRPDLILLDISMPDMDGFETAERFRKNAETKETPVIFVSAKGQIADKVRAFKLGAEDYLVKPFDHAELLARVGKALVHRERALGASPTTRLPGSDVIEVEIERRLSDDQSHTLCYLDLDNLKAFNDYYGYAKADGIIRQTGDIIRDVVAKEGSSNDFIGHIAGDDFVFLLETEKADAVCQTICRSFDRLIPLYYNRVDRERGFIETKDRYGKMRKFPVMSVSIAALTTTGHTFRNYAEVADAEAKAKKQAKDIPGSCYLRDGQVVDIVPLEKDTAA